MRFPRAQHVGAAGDLRVEHGEFREVKSRLATLESGQGMLLQQFGHLSTTIRSRR